MEFHPRSYQNVAIDKIKESPAAGLFLRVGAGKTVSTLTAVEYLKFWGDTEKVLIIAPLRVAEDTWLRESHKWDHTKHFTLSRVLGSQKERVAALERDADIYVINRENVDWLVNHYGKKWPFDMVIIDELSSFKSPSAIRFRALKRVRPRIKRVVGLTGTPSPNGLIDLWPQIYLLDGGQRLGKTMTEYKQRYFMPGGYIRNAKGQMIVTKYEPKPGAAEQIYEAISDIVISIDVDYTIPVINNYIPLKLPADAVRLMEKFEEEEVLKMAEGGLVTAANAAVLRSKFVQMAGGAVYDDKTGDYHEIHNVKLDALEGLIEEAQGAPVMVFYNFKHEQDRIKKRFKYAKDLKGPGDIAKWNAGEISLLVLHPASAGHGLNLQDGGNLMVWYGLPDSLELYEQACGRLARQGQKNTVIINHLVAEGTVDEIIQANLESKGSVQDALMDAVKVKIKKHL